MHGGPQQQPRCVHVIAWLEARSSSPIEWCMEAQVSYDGWKPGAWSNWKPGGGCKPAESAAKMALSSAVLACCHKSSHHNIPSGFHRNSDVPVGWKAAAHVRTYVCNSLRLAYSFGTWLETRLHSSFSPLPRPVTWLEACSDCLEACGHKSKKAPLNAHGLVLVSWGGD